MHSWMDDFFLFRVTAKPVLLKKDNSCRQETQWRTQAEREASQRTRLFLVIVAEFHLMIDWAPGKHPSHLILGSAAGNEPHIHELVRGTIVIRVPSAISSSARPLMQIGQDVTVTSGTDWDTEIDDNQDLFWIWPYGKDSTKRGTVILILQFNNIAKAILKLSWKSKREIIMLKPVERKERENLSKIPAV